MTLPRYTESQVLCGLREAWIDCTGAPGTFEAATRIDAYMKADKSWDDLDLAEVFKDIELFFGFTCDIQEWKTLFGIDVNGRGVPEWEREIAPRLTFGALAQFVAVRAPVITTFAPTTIFGRPCAPAGVFIGIQDIANHCAGRTIRLQPSARIIDVFHRTGLEHFWAQVRWMTEDSIPELAAAWRNAPDRAIWACFFALVGSLTLFSLAWNPWWIVGGVLTALASCAAAWIYRFSNPIPTSIETFRDLALRIAQHDRHVERNMDNA